MTTKNTGQHIPPGLRPRPAGKVDFTFMYAAHDAFNRDLRRLAAAAGSGRTADPAVRTGWATFKNQLHIHHTAEDRWLWPEGWAAFGKAAGKSGGLRGAAELFPWILDGAPADTSTRLLGMLPPPARLLYRALWRPGYARTPRWATATI
jgi:hypothetical protein